MAKKTIIRLTEADVMNMVKDAYGKVKNTLNKGYNKVADWSDKQWDTFERGKPRLEGNPQNEEAVFDGNGWDMLKPINGRDGATYIPAKPQQGLHFDNYGLSIDKLVEDFNQHYYNGKNVVSYIDKQNPQGCSEYIIGIIQRMNQDPKLKYVELFKFDF